MKILIIVTLWALGAFVGLVLEWETISLVLIAVAFVWSAVESVRAWQELNKQ
jgi:hypothetical protein